ncbi:uncharacterized protein CEXT_216991 [Caerostris extrusa]|uniref:Uncharacterized protein n=1 Tax=Caerostris extrusa TaxID=172846 RepID=A0AAV4P994_CAEEX|nr:uncharacterized protein CEXT_216991 [Caerostris extrusa]
MCCLGDFVCCLAKVGRASEKCEDLRGTNGGQSRLVHLVKFAEDFRLGNSGSEIKEWTTQRRITIRTINELREKLDSICVGSNYVKHTGNSVGILGTITSVVGSFMSMFELSSVPIIKNIGDLMYHSEELINVVKVLYEFSRLRTKTGSFKETVDLMKRGEFSLNIDTDVTAEHFRKFSKQLDNCPEISDEIKIAVAVFSASNNAYQLVRDGAKLYRYLKGEVSSEITTLRKELSLLNRIPKDIAVYSALRMIDIAENVLSLLDAAKIIKEGKSKYSDGLKELTDKLELELNSMTSNYS